MHDDLRMARQMPSLIRLRTAFVIDPHAERKSRPRHRIDLRHRARHCARAGRRRRRHRAQRLRRCRRDRKAAHGHRRRIQGQGDLRRRRHVSKPAEIEAMVDRCDREARPRRHPGQQRRHPARRQRSRIFRRNAGTRSSPSTCRRRSMRSASRCRRCWSATGAASSTSRARTAWSRASQKVAYVAAKHGLVGLTKVVALETAKTGVTCNAICPGWVLTPLVQKQIEARAAKREDPGREGQDRTARARSSRRCEFVTPEQLGALRGVPVLGRRPRRSAARRWRWTAAGPRSDGCRVPAAIARMIPKS